MKRREFLSTSVVTAACLSAPLCAADYRSITVTVRKDKPLYSISPEFMGLGYETASVGKKGLLSPVNTVYTQLVRTLGSRGVIRIGGDTADYVRYSPKGTAVSSSLGTILNDAVLRDLGEFLKVTGWKLIWALNLGTGSEVETVAQAKAIHKIAGAHLLALEIGNEPDFFVRNRHRRAEYGYESWLAEYRRYKAALRAQLPGVPLAGPDVAVTTDWATRFAADEGTDAVLVAHHYYLGPQGPDSTIEKILGTDAQLQPQLSALLDAARKSGVPYRICEANSFAGGGREGVSDSMASALWALDYMFTLAANGCAGINMETGLNQRGFVSYYSPIGDDNQGHYSAAPEYYGMLAFSISGRGRLLSTEVAPDLSSVKAYATEPHAGLVAITIINKGNTPAAASVRVPGNRASVLRLSAPSVEARTGVSLGGAVVSPTGTWKPSKSESLRAQHGEFVVTVPAASAAIVQIM